MGHSRGHCEGYMSNIRSTGVRAEQPTQKGRSHSIRDKITDFGGTGAGASLIRYSG